MRITFVAPFSMEPKGTTRWRALPLAKALAARGHSARLLVPSWDYPAHAGRRWTDGGVEVLCVPFPASLGAAAWPLLLARLYREAMRGAPDVLHAFKPIGFSGAVASAALRFRRGDRPAVWVDADDYEAEWARVQGRPGWVRSVLARQERQVLSRADSVTVASQALGELVAGWRGREPVYVPNTSTLQFLDVPEAPGRVVWYTRFLDFPPDSAADIWANIVATNSKFAPTLHVVGAGLRRANLEFARDEEQAFRATIEARGLTETVSFAGWVEGEALERELASACVAIFPFADTAVNRYKCPARLADLAALGVPVVAHAVGECAAYVAHGETGLLVPPGDLTGFAESVARLLRDEPLRARMRRAARARFAAHFAPETLAERLQRAYLEPTHP